MPGADLPRCPVLGCGARSDRWAGQRSGYSLPSLDTFTLLLDPAIDVAEGNRICEKCYNTHRRPKSDAGGRTRIIPTPPPDTLLELFAAAMSSSAQPFTPPPSPLLHPLRPSRLRRLLLLLHLPPRLLALCPTLLTLLSDSVAIVHRSSASASWRKQRLHSTLLCTSPSPSPSSSFLVLTSPPLPYSFPSSTICRLSSVVHTPLCPAALPGRHQRHGCRGRSALAAEQVHHLGHVIFLPSYTASSMVSHCVQIARTPVSDPFVTLE